MATDLKTEQWQHCYDDGWADMIVPEAFAHPAKFSRGLISRIIEHGLAKGYWRAGDVIADPFGGVALGGIIAGYHGLNWLGVELEPRFVSLGNQNLDLHRVRWLALGYAVDARLIQGDSRRFAAIVAQAAGIVTSPPYDDNTKHDHTHNQRDDRRGCRQGRGCHRGSENYGETSGQIGNLPAGNVDAVVTSPPYIDRSTEPHKLGRGKPTLKDGDSAGRIKGDYFYPKGPLQIAELPAGNVDACITSPPWTDARSDTTPSVKGQTAPTNHDPESIGDSPDQIVKLVGGRVDAVVTSPPYIGNLKSTINNRKSQIPQETYWQAMRQVYAQCRLALKPGGFMAVVVKDYVKGGRRVSLCDDTLRLLGAVGFEPVERVHAMLAKQWREDTLFEGTVTKTKERKSFFRRLAEKRGSPRIDFEEVLFVRSSSVPKHQKSNIKDQTF